MAFDTNAFMASSLEHRTEAVPVPGLKKWFPDDEEPTWTVRGLSGSELSRAIEAEAKQNKLSTLVGALVEGKPQSERIKEVRAALGLTGDVPGEMAKRLEMLAIGSIAPKVELNTAVKLATNFPIEFYSLTNKIIALTGMGAEPDPGKSLPSGPIQPSEGR